MAKNHLDDQELVSQYMNGNEQAFEILLMRHKDRIYRTIYSKVRDEELTEDIFQDTFLKVIRTLKLGNYNEEGKFLPWALRIAQNLIIDHFRKSNRMKMIGEKDSRSEDFTIFSVLKLREENAEQTLARIELEEQMVALMEHLPEPQREMILLRLFNDLSFKEISESEDVSINTALGRMRYGLINMRNLIDKHQLEIDIDLSNSYLGHF